MKNGKLFTGDYLFFLAFAFLLFVQQATAQLNVPPLQGKRIHDHAQILNEVIIGNLEHELRLYQDTSSNQIAVLIIPSLNGDLLEDYSLRVATTWELGQKSKDNGVLFLIVLDGRQLRIEVGRGLQGVLTDALCSQIIRNEMVPELRNGNYDVAVVNGIHAVIKAIGNEYTLSDGDVTDDSNRLSLKVQILLGVILVIILGTMTYLALFAENPRGWGLYFFLIPFYGFPMILLGLESGLKLLVGYVVIIPLAKVIIANTTWGKAKIKRMRGWSQNSGGHSSSSRDSSRRSSGGGSFSGGGGSFDGGGSNGRW